MKKYFLLLAALFLLGCIATEKGALASATTPVAFPRACFENGKCISLEIAGTEHEREVGLMNRTFLSNNSGMLFVFEQKARHAFWMKNTLIPLDILWLDAKENESAGNEYGIVDVQTMLPCKGEPCKIYEPALEARYALEMGAGLAEEHGLAQGRKVSIQLSQAS